MNESIPANEGSARSAALPLTERRNAASAAMDDMSALDLLVLLNQEDQLAVASVTAVLPQLAILVESAADRVRSGGTVHYFGAGTSGRLAVLDAAELIPTFAVSPTLVQAHIAGGERAIAHAVERSEDSDADGIRDARDLGLHDVAIGLTASGTTPYVWGALRTARANGALTALVTSNGDSPLTALADIFLAPLTGAEVLTGSTRLKAGTAEKVILNGFSTALMVALGRTYSNLMVSMIATNAKLEQRTLRILGEIGQGSDQENSALLQAAEGDLKLAVVSMLSGGTMDASREALVSAGGSVREAVKLLGSSGA
ncbi:N-acetylmuramic acid 6-phosphate etherase [Glaciihabitans sp. UYNi722]|uniref:N-acetylmuramic acid 6-phosphate etherase n=1 Tax=Glaciihabitans sp. UYNi722 TaxID=3156344 RepID=UPI003393AAF4